MRIALLISGRIKRYEVCLLPFLKANDKYEIDLFISVNDTDCEYYDIVRKDLSFWLRELVVNVYTLPLNFKHTHEFKYANLLIDNEWKPYNQMSMYYNDSNVLNIAYNYSIKKNIKYDFYMKYRADIINLTMPNLLDLKENILYSIQPQCTFISHGIYKKNIVSDAWCWGNYNIMKQYCDTYSFVLNKLDELNGNYYIGFEDCITDNCYDKNLIIIYINQYYNLDKHRRIYDIKYTRNE